MELTLIDLKAQAYDALSKIEFNRAQLNEINQTISQIPVDGDPARLKPLKAAGYDALAQLQTAQAELAELNMRIRNYTLPTEIDEAPSVDQNEQNP